MALTTSPWLDIRLVRNINLFTFLPNLLYCPGAAISLLDSVYLPLHISGVTFKTVGYGLPRVCFSCDIIVFQPTIDFQVGNPAFANYVDAHLDLTHINNKYCNSRHLLVSNADVCISVGKTSFPSCLVRTSSCCQRNDMLIIPYQVDSWAMLTLLEKYTFKTPVHGSPVPVSPDSSNKCIHYEQRAIGQDNTNSECIVGDVPTILQGNTNDHDGPYDGVTMGC
jgi:hypothetical protein